jgi:hypothetical protein
MKSRIAALLAITLLMALCIQACSSEGEMKAEASGVTYVNKDVDCSFTMPEGWQLKEMKQKNLGPNLFIVQYFAEDFDSSVVFLAQENTVDFDAEEAVEMDISNMQAAEGVDFELISKGPIKLKNYNAYQMSDKFTQRGITFYQKRIYIVEPDYIYGIVFNAKTQEAFDEDVLVFDKALKSLSINK